MKRQSMPEKSMQSLWLMTCLTLSQPNYYHHGLILRFIRKNATPKNGMAISSCPPGNLLAKQLVEQYTHRCFQFLPECFANSNSVEWKSVYPYPGFDDVPVSLSNCDTETTFIQHPFIGGNECSVRRRRRLDGFCSPKNKIEVIHIAEPTSRVVEIFAGCEAVISRDQPALLLEIANSDQIHHLMPTLGALNYLLLDSSLLPVFDADDFNYSAALESETCFLGLSKTFLEANGLAKVLWPTDELVVSHDNWQQALIAGLIREARNGGIHFAARPQSSYRYLFNDQLLCEGFYPTEYHDGNSWRWLGPKPSATVWLPQPRTGTYCLTLTIFGAPAEEMILATRLFLVGQPLELDHESNDGVHTLVASFNFSVERDSGYIRLEITTPYTQRASPDDPRRLGVCVSHLELTAIDSGD